MLSFIKFPNYIIMKTLESNTPNTPNTPGGTTEEVRKYLFDGLDRLNQFNVALNPQYNAWKEGQDGNTPDFCKILNSFSSNQIEIANSYESPYILMVPIKDEDSGDITGYEPVIAEGGKNIGLYEDDNAEGRLGHRTSNRIKNRRRGEGGMNEVVYQLLVVTTNEARSFIDTNNTIILDEEWKDGNKTVKVGIPGDDGAGFTRINVGISSSEARFRSSVKGNLITI